MSRRLTGTFGGLISAARISALALCVFGTPAKSEFLSGEKFHEFVYLNEGVILPQLLKCSAENLEAPGLPIWCRVGAVDIAIEEGRASELNLDGLFGNVSSHDSWTTIDRADPNLLPIQALDWGFEVGSVWSRISEGSYLFCSMGDKPTDSSSFQAPVLRMSRCFHAIEGSAIVPGKRMLQITFYDLGAYSFVGQNTPTDLKLFESVVQLVALSTYLELRKEE